MAQSTSDAPEQLGEVRSPTRRSFDRRRIVPIGLTILLAGCAAWYFLSRPKTGNLELSGRIEGYETDVGTKAAGRVEQVTVREGAQVKRGDLLVLLDDAELRASLEGAAAELAAARQQEANARLQISVLQSQINEARLNLQQDQGETAGQVSQAEATVASAIAQLREAEAEATRASADVRLAQVNRDRYAQLVQQGAVPQQRFDQAQTDLETAQATLRSQQAAVEAAQRQVAAAQGGLVQTRTTTLNPNIRNTQISRLNTQLEQARAQLAAAQAQVANAQAVQSRIQAQLGDLTISSPIDGVVTARSVEPGVVVNSGKTLLSLVDLNTVYLRGFIPEGEIGRVRVGQSAHIYLDTNPHQPLTGRVAAVDAEASFTPENIYFREDRVRQVFGVRISIDDPGGFAKPGMPADAEILIDPNEATAQ